MGLFSILLVILFIPTDGGSEDTAHENSNNGPNGRGAAKDTQCTGSFRPDRISRGQDGQGTWNSKSSTHALKSTADRKHNRGMGKPVDDSPYGEPGNTHDVNVAVSKHITQSSAQQEERTVGKRISR